MSGWLAVIAARGGLIDPSAWSRAVGRAAPIGERLTERDFGAARMAVWRRGPGGDGWAGEFPRSGTLTRADDGSTTAWVGQCVEDSGDATDAAIAVVSAGGDLGSLNGAFAAAVWSSSAGRLRVCTDRHAHYPVYIVRGRGIVAAGTELRAVTPFLDEARIDRDALDLFLRIGETLERRTILSGVGFMPGGTVLELDGAAGREREYWRFRNAPDRSISFRDATEELARRLTRSVRRMERACPRLGVPLSGGLDSRLILGLCEHPNRVPSFTWGLPGCRDLAYAERFARLVGSPHTAREWNPAAFPPLWAEGVARTGGCFGVHEMFVLPFASMVARACDVTLNGLAGDVFLGGNFLKRSWFAAESMSRLADATWSWRTGAGAEGWVDRMTRSSGPRSRGRSLWSASLEGRAGPRPIEALNDWLFENRIFRYTNCGTMLLRGDVESHAPFWDRDVVDFLLRVPLEYRVRHRLYLAVLNRACPTAGRVAWQRTGIPPSWGFVASLGAQAYHKFAGVAGRRVGLRPFASMAVADPAGWFRGPWREAARRLVLSERLADRGIIDHDAVRAAFDAHQSGEDLTRQIGVLVAVELLCRAEIDREVLLARDTADRPGAGATLT
ncbi:MAG: hypothetical protein JNM07_11510 [Phycisphaerae bacterium]|nr:hypothetical protein [Phycisphaerae bacterium]